ncbi:MAG: hypothetical protein ABI395_05460 [Sphingobium sp.]
MSSFFRTGGKLRDQDEYPLGNLILAQTKICASTIDKMNQKERKTFFERIMDDEISGDPSFLARERAMTMIVKALAAGDISVYLIDKQKRAIRISALAWFIERIYVDPDPDFIGDPPIFPEYRIGLLQSSWAKASFGSDGPKSFYSKRHGCRLVLHKRDAEEWLRRNDLQPRRHRPYDALARKIYPRLSLAARTSSTRDISRMLRRAGIPRSVVESIEWPGRPRRGPKAK